MSAETFVRARRSTRRRDRPALRSCQGGRATRDRRWTRARRRRRAPEVLELRGGERLDVEFEFDEPLAAEGPPVPVRFEDAHLLVIAKPPGPDHPTEQRRTSTLVNRLLGMGIPLSRTPAALASGHRAPARRRDVGVDARREGDEAHVELSRMLQKVTRWSAGTSRSCVAGWSTRRSPWTLPSVAGPSASWWTTARAGRPRPASRSAYDCPAPRSRAAPRTGQTHQIRVHLRAIGHPILGDRAYGGGGDDAAALGLHRPFLHSWRIAFDHPAHRGAGRR